MNLSPHALSLNPLPLLASPALVLALDDGPDTRIDLPAQRAAIEHLWGENLHRVAAHYGPHDAPRPEAEPLSAVEIDDRIRVGLPSHVHYAQGERLDATVGGLPKQEGLDDRVLHGRRRRGLHDADRPRSLFLGELYVSRAGHPSQRNRSHRSDSDSHGFLQRGGILHGPRANPANYFLFALLTRPPPAS